MENIYYHGSPYLFEKFSLQEIKPVGRMRQHGDAIYFSKLESLAKSIAHGHNGYLYTIKYNGEITDKTEECNPIALKYFLSCLINPLSNNPTSQIECLAVYDDSKIEILNVERINQISS